LWPAAVLFDLDGTLADSFAGIRQALNAALVELGMVERSLDWVREHVGRGAAALVRDAAGEGAGDDGRRDLGERFREHYRSIYLDATPPLPGAGEALAVVWRRTNGRVAVISNKYEVLSRAWLAHTHMLAHVAIVVGPDTYGAPKPDAGVVRPVLEAFAVEPASALLVGDMVVDVETGRASGVPVVGVQGDPDAAARLSAAGALVVIDCVAELPAWLADHGRGWRLQ
jgi:phosphoglycolate phosphatase